ncbi:dihydrofolate reductase family protein [Dactylosporangium sp. NPDC000555]|uniref:dihydrofolate reductase family protein n=1 Tax=Dactylosporangium sp. NPDC000555 TaxID=3154260 RepID=UPI00331DD7CA
MAGTTGRHLIVSTFATLDGAQDDPMAWSLDYWSDEYGQRAREQLFDAGALLMGRVTYEAFAATWPLVADDGTSTAGSAARMNSIPKHVVSSTLDTVGWENSALVKGDVVEAVRELKRQPGGAILMYGFGGVARTLVKHGLVDEIRTWVHPVVRGRGESIFTGWPETRLRLAWWSSLPKGVMIMAHRPEES